MGTGEGGVRGNGGHSARAPEAEADGVAASLDCVLPAVATPRTGRPISESSCLQVPWKRCASSRHAL